MIQNSSPIKGVFAFKVLQLGILNAGATFQQAMDVIFAPQIGRNIQVYVDKIFSMSLKASDNIKYLRETFKRIRTHNM